AAEGVFEEVVQAVVLGIDERAGDGAVGGVGFVEDVLLPAGVSERAGDAAGHAVGLRGGGPVRRQRDVGVAAGIGEDERRAVTVGGRRPGRVIGVGEALERRGVGAIDDGQRHGFAAVAEGTRVFAG